MSNISFEEFLEKHEEWRKQQDGWCRVLTENGPLCMPMNDLMRPPPKSVQKPSDEEKQQAVSEFTNMLMDYVSRQHSSSNTTHFSSNTDLPSISHDAQDGFLPVFGKDSYLSYREKFMRVCPFDDCLGKKNPYTGTPVSSQDDYEMYCLSRYLKYTAEEEVVDLQARYQLLKEENASLHLHLSKLNKKASTLFTVICFLAAFSFVLFIYFCVTI